MRSKPKQLELELRTWGGVRDFAGRPRKTRELEHLRRDPLNSRHPVHVTLKVVREVGSLRGKARFVIVRDAIKAANLRAGLRIVHFSVMSNHLHLLVEASDARMLGRGMQALNIRIARRINKLVGRQGRVFSDRYDRHDLKTPREVRNSLAYVLLNYRKHASQRGERCPREWMDPCSSGGWFDGWSRAVKAWPQADAPTMPPETWLLRAGWRKHHPLIAPDEIPSLEL